MIIHSNRLNLLSYRFRFLIVTHNRGGFNWAHILVSESALLIQPFSSKLKMWLRSCHLELHEFFLSYIFSIYLLLLNVLIIWSSSFHTVSRYLWTLFWSNRFSRGLGFWINFYFTVKIRVCKSSTLVGERTFIQVSYVFQNWKIICEDLGVDVLVLFECLRVPVLFVWFW